MSSWIISLMDDSGFVEDVDLSNRSVKITGALADAVVFPEYGEAKAVANLVRKLQPELRLELDEVHNSGHVDPLEQARKIILENPLTFGTIDKPGN